MTFLTTSACCLGVMLCAVVLVLVVPQPSFPSIDDQIKKSLEPFDMLYRVGIVRDKIQQRTTRILHAKYPTNEALFFEERYYHSKYYKEDNRLPQMVLDAVMKDSLLLGTEKIKMEMRNEIKREFNNGTLTDVAVQEVLSKILRKLRAKTKNELKKYINEVVKKDIKDTAMKSFEPFNMLYRVGIARTIIEETINKTLREDHVKNGTGDSIVFNKSHYARHLKKDVRLQRRILDAVLNDSLFLGTNQSLMEMKNEIKRDYSNGTLSDEEVDNVLILLVKKLRSKTNSELKKYITRHVHKDVNNSMVKRKQQKIKKRPI
uniref:Uncharacterized protein n=2 Tax=Cacopsylla melanoneura TaxID=428564 RepID=A0A8D8YRH7_9HEMI